MTGEGIATLVAHLAKQRPTTRGRGDARRDDLGVERIAPSVGEDFAKVSTEPVHLQVHDFGIGLILDRFTTPTVDALMTYY